MLFFGNIAPYKGLEYLIAAFSSFLGKTTVSSSYRREGKRTRRLLGQIRADPCPRRRCAIESSQRIEYVPDEETELYFKAADVWFFPTHMCFRVACFSWDIALGCRQSLPTSGLERRDHRRRNRLCVSSRGTHPTWPRKIERYFESDLFLQPANSARAIKAYANERYSWDEVAAITTACIHAF